MGFDPRVDIGEGADRAGNLAGRDLLAGGEKALAVARELGPVPGQLQPEGGRLGVDAVAAGDRRRVFVLDGAAPQRRQQGVEVGDQDVGGAGQLHRQAGVEHVARGHALVDETPFRPDMLGDIGQEGDGLVMDLALDLTDALDLERPALAQCLRRASGDDAERLLRLAGVDFDVELDAEIGFRLPDRRHLRTAVARDHAEAASLASPPGSSPGS